MLGQAPSLLISDSFLDINGSHLIELIMISKNKINLKIEKKVITKVFKNDKEFLKAIREPIKFDKQFMDYMVVEIAKMNYWNVLDAMIDLGADLSVKSKFYQKNTSILGVVWKQMKRDSDWYKTLTVLTERGTEGKISRKDMQ